jgi:hypothetical protein
MIAELLDRIIETDLFTSAKRTGDTQRYTMMRCREQYDNSIDENDIHLFLIGGSLHTLTREQCDFISACKTEMHGMYRNLLFRLMQYDESLCLGMAGSIDTIRKMLIPNLSLLTVFEHKKEKAG